MMPLSQYLLAEFDMQAPCTRKFLERLPEDKLTWKPHARSMTAGQLAFHLATTPGGVVQAVKGDTLPFPKFGPQPQPAAKADVLKAFDECIATVRATLPKYDDAHLMGMMRVVDGDRELFTLPRIAFLRDIMFSHWYQHRGQMSVYLRLLDVPVPSSFGPSADEQPAFLQPAAATA